MSQNGTQNHRTLITKQCDVHFPLKKRPICLLHHILEVLIYSIFISTLNFLGYLEI